MKTIRKKIIDELEKNPYTAEELSEKFRLKERDVIDHLNHIDKSVKALGKQLNVRPYYCIACGYTFKERKRFSKPGRCPACKEQRIGEAEFQIL